MAKFARFFFWPECVAGAWGLEYSITLMKQCEKSREEEDDDDDGGRDGDGDGKRLTWLAIMKSQE
jgi:hypothetical protein